MSRLRRLNSKYERTADILGDDNAFRIYMAAFSGDDRYAKSYIEFIGEQIKQQQHFAKQGVKVRLK